MSDKSFTFFEIHLHDGISFSPTNNAPAIGRWGGDEASDGEPDGTGSALSGGPFGSSGDGGNGHKSEAVGALLVLALLVAAAAAARSFRRDDEPGEMTELEDFAEE